MKFRNKLIGAAVCCALAVATSPVTAGVDDGEPLPPNNGLEWEFYNFMCNFLGVEYYCKKLNDLPPPTTEPVPGTE